MTVTGKYRQVLLRRLLAFSVSVLIGVCAAYAQSDFGTGTGMDSGTGNMQNSQDTAVGLVKAKPSFTIKQYFRALAHKDTMPIANMWAASIFLPGTAQIYNRDYWKLPVIYGGIGAMAGTAYWSNLRYLNTGDRKFAVQRDLLYAGAILVWWGSMLDGVACFESSVDPLPPRASLYSALLPGLGQMYNGDYWKVPIFYTGFLISGYLWSFNSSQYLRYKQMYKDAIAAGENYTGLMTPDDIKWRRDVYRRYRDYSIIATALIYVLNIVDANVFAYMHDFDISDDLSMKIEPAVIDIMNVQGNYSYTNNQMPAMGIKMNIKF